MDKFLDGTTPTGTTPGGLTIEENILGSKDIPVNITQSESREIVVIDDCEKLIEKVYFSYEKKMQFYSTTEVGSYIFDISSNQFLNKKDMIKHIRENIIFPNNNKEYGLNVKEIEEALIKDDYIQNERLNDIKIYEIGYKYLEIENKELYLGGRVYLVAETRNFKEGTTVTFKIYEKVPKLLPLVSYENNMNEGGKELPLSKENVESSQFIGNVISEISSSSKGKVVIGIQLKPQNNLLYEKWKDIVDTRTGLYNEYTKDNVGKEKSELYLQVSSVNYSSCEKQKELDNKFSKIYFSLFQPLGEDLISKNRRELYVLNVARALTHNPKVSREYQTKLTSLLNNNNIIYVDKLNTTASSGNKQVKAEFFGVTAEDYSYIKIGGKAWRSNQLGDNMVKRQLEHTILHEVRHILIRNNNHLKGFDDDIGNMGFDYGY